MARTLSIIGVPSSAGAYAPGQEKTPRVLREQGLTGMLRKAGLNVEDLGDVEAFRWRPDLASPHAMHVDKVVSAATEAARKVGHAFANDRFALVLGGDCTIELGTVSAAVGSGGNVGLIYIDMDTDLNTPETTDEGALDWMGVAHILGIEGSIPKVARLGARFPLLPPDAVYFFGCGNVRPWEQVKIDELGIAQEPIDAVVADPAGTGARAALEWGAKFDTLLIHLDIDVLNFAAMPLAENVRRTGLSFEALSEALRAMLRAGNVRALTIAEVNPDHGAEDGSTIRQLGQTLATLLGGAAALQ